MLAFEKPAVVRLLGDNPKVAYNLGRMELHGMRRAAEMEESAETLAGLDVDPVMTRATAERHRRAARQTAGPADSDEREQAA